MKVMLNRRETVVPPEISNLLDLLNKEDLYGPGRAVAVNNRVIPKEDIATYPLEDGMKITVIKAVCGG